MIEPKRLIYLGFCVLVLVAWIVFGTFEATEAPYVRF